jgi:hypothetical protein
VGCKLDSAARFEVFTGMKIQVVMLRDVTSCSDVRTYPEDHDLDSTGSE